MDHERFVLADTNRLQIWSFYQTIEAATAAAPAVNAKAAEYERPGSPAPVYVPMTLDAYLKAERDHYLASPLKEITHEQYDDMLGCLPPLKWEAMPGGGTRFLISEFTQGSYTSQYADYKGRYFTRTVDAHDRSTWINGIECEQAIAQDKEHGR